MGLSWWKKTLCLAGFAIRGAYSQDDDDGPDLSAVPPNDEFLRRSSGQAVVIGDYVYYDGGEVSQLVGDDENLEFRPSNGANRTLSFNVSSSWDVEDVEIRSLEKSSPNMMRQSLFKRESTNSFYIWGGHTPYAAPVPNRELWRFNTDGDGGGSWGPETPSDPSFFRALQRSEGGASVSTPDAGFHFGGLSSNATSIVGSGHVPGYVVFNYTTQSFSNETNAPWSAYGTLRGATAQYIPSFGPNGLIMLLGGTTHALGNPEQMGMMDFQNLTFFDPVTRDWYYQSTTGTAPTRRQRHCSVGVESSNGTYEIFVYGGRNERNSELFDDVHVLSLPGFFWSKADYEPEDRRIGMACVVVGKRQMLSIGGINSRLGSPGQWEDKDPRPQGLGIFDLSEMSWRDSYDADADEYRSPGVVSSWYDDGGLDSVGWTSDQVASLFDESDPGPGDDDDDGFDGTSPGAIAGGVVGGVALLAIVGLLIWFCCRRRSKKKRSLAHEPLNTESAAASPGYKMVATSPTPHPSELHSVEAYKAEMPSDSQRTELQGSGPYDGQGAVELEGSSTAPATTTPQSWQGEHDMRR